MECLRRHSPSRLHHHLRKDISSCLVCHFLISAGDKFYAMHKRSEEIRSQSVVDRKNEANS